MKDEVRNNLVEQKKYIENGEKEVQRLLEEIFKKADLLVQSEQAKDLRQTGDNYKTLKELVETLNENYDESIQKMYYKCKHPILCRTTYQKHDKKRNRVVPCEKEDAEYCKFRCLECGKIIHSKNKDKADDWDEYIYLQLHVRGQYGDEYHKRPIIDLKSQGLMFTDLFKEYQDEMLEHSEEEMVKKYLKKYGQK